MKLEAPPPRVIADPKLLEEQVSKGSLIVTLTRTLTATLTLNLTLNLTRTRSPTRAPALTETPGSVQQDKALYA